MSEPLPDKEFRNSFHGQTHCATCGEPFIYGVFKGSKFERSKRHIVQDTSRRFHHEDCWGGREDV